MSDNSSHRTWDRLREMYRLTAHYAGYPKIESLREEIKMVMPDEGKSSGGWRAAPA